MKIALGAAAAITGASALIYLLLRGRRRSQLDPGTTNSSVGRHNEHVLYTSFNPSTEVKAQKEENVECEKNNVNSLVDPTLNGYVPTNEDDSITKDVSRDGDSPEISASENQNDMQGLDGDSASNCTLENDICNQVVKGKIQASYEVTSKACEDIGHDSEDQEKSIDSGIMPRSPETHCSKAVEQEEGKSSCDSVIGQDSFGDEASLSDCIMQKDSEDVRDCDEEYSEVFEYSGEVKETSSVVTSEEEVLASQRAIPKSVSTSLEESNALEGNIPKQEHSFSTRATEEATEVLSTSFKSNEAAAVCAIEEDTGCTESQSVGSESKSCLSEIRDEGLPALMVHSGQEKEKEVEEAIVVQNFVEKEVFSCTSSEQLKDIAVASEFDLQEKTPISVSDLEDQILDATAQTKEEGSRNTMKTSKEFSITLTKENDSPVVVTTEEDPSVTSTKEEDSTIKLKEKDSSNTPNKANVCAISTKKEDSTFSYSEDTKLLDSCKEGDRSGSPSDKNDVDILLKEEDTSRSPSKEIETENSQKHNATSTSLSEKKDAGISLKEDTYSSPSKKTDAEISPNEVNTSSSSSNEMDTEKSKKHDTSSSPSEKSDAEISQKEVNTSSSPNNEMDTEKSEKHDTSSSPSEKSDAEISLKEVNTSSSPSNEMETEKSEKHDTSSSPSEKLDAEVSPKEDTSSSSSKEIKTENLQKHEDTSTSLIEKKEAEISLKDASCSHSKKTDAEIVPKEDNTSNTSSNEINNDVSSNVEEESSVSPNTESTNISRQREDMNISHSKEEDPLLDLSAKEVAVTSGGKKVDASIICHQREEKSNDTVEQEDTSISVKQTEEDSPISLKQVQEDSSPLLSSQIEDSSSTVQTTSSLLPFKEELFVSPDREEIASKSPIKEEDLFMPLSKEENSQCQDKESTESLFKEGKTSSVVQSTLESSPMACTVEEDSVIVSSTKDDFVTLTDTIDDSADITIVKEQIDAPSFKKHDTNLPISSICLSSEGVDTSILSSPGSCLEPTDPSSSLSEDVVVLDSSVPLRCENTTTTTTEPTTKDNQTAQVREGKTGEESISTHDSEESKNISNAEVNVIPETVTITESPVKQSEIRTEDIKDAESYSTTNAYNHDHTAELENMNSDAQSLSVDSGQGSIEIEPETLFNPSSFPINSQEQYIFYEFEIPQALVGKLIGRKGAFVNKIKATTDASIVVCPHKNRRLKICSVEGTKQQVDAALEMIRKHFPKNKFPELTLEQVSSKSPSLPPVQPTLNTQAMQIELTAGVVVEVRVSAVVNGGELWVQQPLHPSYSALHRLQTCMNLNYGDGSNTPPLPQPIQAGTVCVAQIDRQWLRSQVLNTVDSTTHVGLLDVGGTVSIPTSHLRQIRYDYMTLPFQASQCLLYGIEPVSEDGWDDVSAAVLEELVSGTIIFTTVVSYTPYGIPLVNLYRRDQDEYVFLNEKLVHLGHAKWMSPQSSS